MASERGPESGAAVGEGPLSRPEDELNLDGLAFDLLSGPEDRGSEQRWRVRLEDGRIASLARLQPELARETSVRRRYVGDVERLSALGVINLAPLLAFGPSPDPRDPQAAAPWRLHLEPTGERLSDWLARRAPATLEEVARVGAALADAVYACHRAGMVLRALRPEMVVLTPEGQVILTDVGLVTVERLSSHRASSLLLFASSYASPEQLYRSELDQRSDLFAVGVMLWQALTGALPFESGVAVALRRSTGPCHP